MSDESVQVKFGVKLDDLFTGLNKAKDAIGSAFEGIGPKVSGMFGDMGASVTEFATKAKAASEAASTGFSGLPATFKAVGGAIAGAVVAIGGLLALKGAADASAAYTEEAMQLARTMGINTTQASIWMAVMQDVGATTGELDSAAKGLTRQLASNEDEMNRMGLVTRNSKGELIGMNELMTNAIAVTNSYREGTDRNLAAQAIFGSGVQGNSKLLLANAKVAQQDEEYLRRLGGVVGVESVQAWKAYNSAMKKINMAMRALRNTIANAVMPVLGKIGDWLAEALPTIVQIARVAIGGLMAAFWALKNSVQVVWETINAMVVTVAEPLRGLAEAMYRAVTGDWEGAKNAITGIGTTISNTWSGAMDEMLKSSEEASTRIAALFGSTDAADLDKSGEQYTPKEDDKQDKKDASGRSTKKAPSDMSAWEAVNSADKAHYELTNNLRVRDLAEDLAYWKSKIAIANTANGDREKVLAKVAAVELAMMKQQSVENKALLQEDVTAKEKSALDGLALTKAMHEQELELGQITKEQFIVLEQQAEDQRTEILRNAQEARLQMVANDPNHSPAALQMEKNKLLEIERAHQLAKTQLATEAAVESTKYARSFESDMTSGFAGVIKTFATGTMTIKNLFANMGKAILSSMIGVFAQIAAKWLATMIMNKIVSKITGLSSVATNAGVAGSAAVASTAAIPIVGPALAPAAGAAAAATAMSFGALMSARGGFDIPAGMNPITQLHEREMVLPSEHADVIRGMAGGGGSGSNTVIMNISTPNADSFRASERQIQRAQALALRGAY